MKRIFYGNCILGWFIADVCNMQENKCVNLRNQIVKVSNNKCPSILG